MLIYEITATVRVDPSERYERYMRESHIPDLLVTGYFAGVTMCRADDRYRVRYETDDLDGYLDNDAARLRADFLEHFPEGVTVERETWEIVEVWNMV